MLFLAGAMPCALNAQPATSNWYAAIQASHVEPDEVRQQRHGAGALALVGLPLGADFSAEVNAFGHRYHGRASTKAQPAYGMGLNLVYRPTWGAGWPFLIAGGGGVYEKGLVESGEDESGNPIVNSGKSTQSAFVQAGLGFDIPGRSKSFLVEGLGQLGLRVDLSWYGVFPENKRPEQSITSDFRLNVGIQFQGAAR